VLTPGRFREFLSQAGIPADGGLSTAAPAAPSNGQMLSRPRSSASRIIVLPKPRRRQNQPSRLPTTVRPLIYGALAFCTHGPLRPELRGNGFLSGSTGLTLARSRIRPGCPAPRADARGPVVPPIALPVHFFFLRRRGGERAPRVAKPPSGLGEACRARGPKIFSGSRE